MTSSALSTHVGSSLRQRGALIVAWEFVIAVVFVVAMVRAPSQKDALPLWIVKPVA
eukprot:CAMPEP_0172484744 /NCGR_PEP_ID=MMETSP1066-20121228/12334_1 /TAXON_ID=671091 /ORGANISM="Coscinodiscus wailesii, Strain CCMP2513" /LENGTH=55 /DNA_ID=CAMNT_0013249461 /DNA_START=8 /DNA_END=171 /DNA_ORIENTATION=-